MLDMPDETEPGDQCQSSNNPPQPEEQNSTLSMIVSQADCTIEVNERKHDDSYRRHDIGGTLKLTSPAVSETEAPLRALGTLELSLLLLPASSLSAKGWGSPFREPVSEKCIVTTEALGEIQGWLSREKKMQEDREEELRQKKCRVGRALKETGKGVVRQNNGCRGVSQTLEENRARTGEAPSYLRIDQEFYQITDQDLTDLIMQLRYSIRDFAIQYFDGDVLNDKLVATGPHYMHWLEYITPGKGSYRRYVGSPGKDHQIIQAFLWKVLTEEIFGTFQWMTDPVSEIFGALRIQLHPSK